MSLYLGENLLAGSFKTGASWEVGDIGQSALGIDESLNKRRYLNGQVISQTQFVQFTAWVKQKASVYINLATTEENWQAEVTNSKLGQCGKFVIDDALGTIRLPKVVNINGLQDLALMGSIKAESLPNITGEFNGGVNNYDTTHLESGAFRANGASWGSNVGSGSAATQGMKSFDASRSSSTYQDNASVQQEAVQYPYFIQVATGIETSVDVTREIELNNPFSLLDYKWSEYEITNASWLLSNGQFNSGATYVSVYELLLKIHNGTETKDGVSVKLSTETYTDTDFVINTTDTTFRLPIKVKLASGNRVAGNGMALGLTDGTNNFAFQTYPSLSELRTGTANFNQNVGTSGSYNDRGTKLTVGVTTDHTKSGIETSANGLYLYFYVGETIQDANVIAASNVLTDIANIGSRTHIVETYQNGSSWYRIWSDGWCEQGGIATTVGQSGATITLLKSFTDTNYSITGISDNNATGGGFHNVIYYDKANNGFKIASTYGGQFYAGIIIWTACGYIS